MRDLEPSVQAFVFRVCLQLAIKPGKDQSLFLFVLSSYNFNGYGRDAIDIEQGILCLKASAARSPPGCDYARAYLYRLLQAHEKPPAVTDRAVTDYLPQMAIRGSRAALEDLSVANPLSYTSIKQQLHLYFGGVGASFFVDENMLHGHNVGYLTSPDHFSEILERNTPTDFKVNRRGDYLLHFAASCALLDHVDRLIRLQHIDPDQVNVLGETALLCACRAGHPDVVRLLLHCGANPAIAAPNGETPLHWLISFDDDVLETIGEELIKHGGDPNCSTKQRVCHSVFRGTIDADFQPPGTPLNWAVHRNRPQAVKLLLQHGANPQKLDGYIQFAALNWAAFMHHHQCLRLMIDRVEEIGTKVDFNTLLGSAARSSDRFSMILRHGSRYKDQMLATFDLLRDNIQKRKISEFDVFCNGFKQSLLFDASSESHDDAVEYMLNHRIGFRNINDTGGEDAKTALLASVRRNRKQVVRLLIHHGANVQAYERNPFNKLCNSWTVLHEFACAGHENDTSLAEELIVTWSVSVHGRPPNTTEIETPFGLSVILSNFELADTLLRLGTNPNALSVRSMFLVVPWPLTVLGHIIITNARHSKAQVQYLLSKENVDFVVEPERGLTALHRASWAHREVRVFSGESLSPEDFNMTTNRDIIFELLQRFNSASCRDAKCRGRSGWTALHFAVDARNVAAVEGLIRFGANVHTTDDHHKTPLMMAREVQAELPSSAELAKIVKELEKVN
jgi:ankyrin repeat protein